MKKYVIAVMILIPQSLLCQDWETVEIKTHKINDKISVLEGRGGNELFAKKGTVILAQDNVRKRMSADQFMEWMDRQVPASPKAALPVITFQDKVSFYLNNEETKVIPGHGQISLKSDLAKFRDQLIDIRSKIMPMIEAGKTRDEVISENPIAGYDELWPNGFVKGKDFLLLVYDGLKAGN